MPTPFLGQLNTNEVYASMFNMIISQETFADNLEGLDSTLVNEARVDGSLYGDTKLYYSANILHSNAWGNDAEATNLLELHRPKGPETQFITLDVFRQIALTEDSYLSKRAWSDEGAFGQFQSVMISMIQNTKIVYDLTTYNSFFGTNVSSKPKQNIEFELPNDDTEEHRRLRSQLIGSKLAKLFIALGDPSRDYNDYGHMRAYSKSQIKVVWNADYVTDILKLDLPTIFNKENVFAEGAFKRQLPAKYFGNINTSGGTTTSPNTNVRSLIEKDYNTVKPGQPGYDETKFLFAGELLPASTAYEANETYTEDPKVICKICIKLPPFMSAFETGTSFFNPRSLTTNHYKTWGHNTLEHLSNYPFITIKAKSLAKKA